MGSFTAPISAAFELQRTVLESSQEFLETSIDYHTGVADTLVMGIDRQETVQRRLLALQHVAWHRLTGRVDERVPQLEPATEEVLSVVDQQFSQLYASHSEVYDEVIDDLEAGSDACDELGDQYLAALDTQVAVLANASQAAESQTQLLADQYNGYHESELTTLQQQVEPSSASDD